MKEDTKQFLALSLLCLACISCFVYGIFERSQQIKNKGVIRVIGVQIFEDANLTSVLQEIDWGLVSPNETKTFGAWVLNTGNDQVKLLMWTQAWLPLNASDWITLSWNYSETIIQPNASIEVKFLLHVDANIRGIENFAFEIWIMGVKV